MKLLSIYRLLRCAAVMCCLTAALPSALAQDVAEAGDDAVEMVLEDSVAGLDSAGINPAIAHAMIITPAELDSPTMNEDKVVNVTPTKWEQFFDWCLDHLFIVGVGVIVLIYALFWLIHKICSFLI